MQDITRSLAAQVRKIILDKLRKSRPNEIRDALRNLFKKQGFSVRVRAELLRQSREIIRQVEKEVVENFVQAYTANDRITSGLNKIVRIATSSLRRSDKRTEDRVLDEVMNGIGNGDEYKTIARRVADKVNATSHQIQTASNTSGMAMDRALRIEQAQAAGVEYFLYDGPPGERDFCNHKVGKVFHIDQIRKMRNGQSLPVEYYCGGYNCRHDWVPLVNYDPDQNQDNPTL